MTATLTAPFSEYNQQVKELVEYHLRIEGSRLILALRYQPERLPNDVFLFEVIEEFGLGMVDDEQTLFEAAYDSSEGFPMPRQTQLHMILTNP